MSNQTSTSFGRTPMLGLSERWSLARHNVGNPIIVVFSATLPQSLIDKSELQAAVAYLSQKYPMLRCAIRDRTTNEPKYYMMADFEPNNIVKVKPLNQGSDLPQVLLESVMHGVDFDADAGPLWEVQLQQAQESDQRDRLVLITDHIINDGVGVKNLFSELLSSLSSPSTANGLQESTKLPARLDEICDFRSVSKPTARPSPPAHLSSFPAKQPGYSPRKAQQQFFTFSIPPDQLAKLIATGKQHNVRTLHPILYAAGLFALYHAVSPESTHYFGTATPFSHRDEADNPPCTGNYVTFHIKDEVVLPSTRFWDKAREFSEELRDPATKHNAKKALGGFAAFSDMSVMEGSGKTGWEDAINGLIDHPDGSHKLAFVVSNVGVMKMPREGKLAGLVQEVCFAQTSSQHAGAFLNSVVTAEDGSLMVACGTRTGATPQGVYEKFQKLYPAVLRSIVDGQCDEEVSAEQMVLDRSGDE